MVKRGRGGQHYREEQADQRQRDARAVGDEGELEGDEEQEVAEIGRIADLSEIMDRAPAEGVARARRGQRDGEQQRGEGCPP